MRLMRFSVFAALMMLVAVSASATSLYTEDFSYTSGTTLVSNGWVTHSASGNPVLVSASGLTYAGYPGSGIDKAAGPTVSGATGDDVSQPAAFTAVSSGAIYAAFMVNVTSATTTGDYFFHFIDGVRTSAAFKGRVFVKKDGTGALAFGVQFGSNTTGTAYTGFSYATGTTYLLVVKYLFNAGAANDQVMLFVNPTLSVVEPAATLTHNFQTTGTPDVEATGLDYVSIRQGSAAATPSVTVDGIRVSDKWGDAGLPVELVQFSID